MKKSREYFTLRYSFGLLFFWFIAFVVIGFIILGERMTAATAVVAIIWLVFCLVHVAIALKFRLEDKKNANKEGL